MWYIFHSLFVLKWDNEQLLSLQVAHAPRHSHAAFKINFGSFNEAPIVLQYIVSR